MKQVGGYLTALCCAALTVLPWLGRAGEAPPPQPQPAPVETPVTPAPSESPPAPQRYPTIRILDFALDRKVSIELRDDYNCPQPLELNGVTLSKPEEMPIDLPTVLRLAGCDNLDFHYACVRLDEAHARTLAAKMEFLPSLRPTFENKWHSGRNQNSRGEFFNVVKQSNRFGPELSIDWQLGESYFHVLAARRRAQAQAANVQVVGDDAKFNAVNAYYELVRSRTEFAIVEDRLKQENATVTLLENLAKGGAGLNSEVKRAQALRAEIKQRLALAREKTRVASLNLTEILHIDPLVTLIPFQESQDLITLVPPEKELYLLVADGFLRRPELKESRAYWNALDKERKAAFLAPLIPNIKVDAFNGSFGHHPADSHHSQDYVLGLGWKIGAGGIGDISRTRISEALQKEEGIRFAKVADKVAREVIESHARVKTTEELIEFSKEEITAAEEALRLSNERLRKGGALTLEVIAAEEVLFNAKSRAAQNITDFNKAQYALLRSIGGFREADFDPVPRPYRVQPGQEGQKK